jgi:hypothetical protein
LHIGWLKIKNRRMRLNTRKVTKSLPEKQFWRASSGMIPRAKKPFGQGFGQIQDNFTPCGYATGV